MEIGTTYETYPRIPKLISLKYAPNIPALFSTCLDNSAPPVHGSSEAEPVIRETKKTAPIVKSKIKIDSLASLERGLFTGVF